MPENMRPSALLLLLLLTFLFATSSAEAQKTVRGTVTDAQTGETLPSTNILIEDSYRGTITNVNGQYTITIPDSLLPATLVVRYIGYQSQRRTITTQSAEAQNFALKPSVTQMGEVVVTGEDPGMRIMREVIERKQQWRKRLDTYRADAYTRQRLANDTSIVMITESASEVFWDKQQGHREVQKSKRQTANIEAADNLAGVSYLPNFYDDNIDIAGFSVVGITHPDALDYYKFELIDQTSLDDRTVYEIKVIPNRKLQPLFKGTAFVLDEAYALLEVDLKPNEVIDFPRPVQSFNASYEQQFNNFGQDFWLPVDVRIGGDVKISMVGLDFPTIKFNQTSRITNYKINTPLPDSLYKKDDVFSVDSTTVDSDSLITKQINTIPLSAEEEQAYATLDSTATLENAFRPSGFLAGLIDDEEDDGSGMFSTLGQLPGSLSPDLRYNRVDQLYAGLRYSINTKKEKLELRAKGGYSTGYKEWNYGAGFTLYWLDSNRLESSVGADYTAQTTTRFDSYIYQPYYTIIPNLLGHKGYFDYYRSEGYRGFTRWELTNNDLSLELGFASKKHSSLPTTTAYDLLAKQNNFRINPPIRQGRMQSVDIIAGYNLNEGYNFGITGRDQIRLAVEHSSDALGSDYDFTRYSGRISWSFPTFYQRRFLANTLDVNLTAGTYSGNLPIQKWGSVDVAIGESAPYGVMKAARNRPYEGDQYIALNLEHNFRTIPFETIGLQPLVERNIGLIIFGGAARTWLNSSSVPAGYQPRLTDGIHWEAGASLNGILGLFRVDFAARLDQPAFLVNISVARLL
jgi:hypothetical protein